MKGKSIKHKRDNIGEYINNLGVGKNSLRQKKEKADKLHFTETKDFCSSRYHKEGENTSPKVGGIL